MPQRQIGVALAALGAVLIIGSFVMLSLPDDGKWFPVLLIGGGVAVWLGINKYRWAR